MKRTKINKKEAGFGPCIKETFGLTTTTTTAAATTTFVSQRATLKHVSLCIVVTGGDSSSEGRGSNLNTDFGMDNFERSFVANNCIVYLKRPKIKRRGLRWPFLKKRNLHDGQVDFATY